MAYGSSALRRSYFFFESVIDEKESMISSMRRKRSAKEKASRPERSLEIPRAACRKLLFIPRKTSPSENSRVPVSAHARTPHRCRCVYKPVSCKAKNIRRSIAFPPRSLGGRGTCDLFRWPIYKLRDTARRCDSKWKIEASPGSFARRGSINEI